LSLQEVRSFVIGLDLLALLGALLLSHADRGLFADEAHLGRLMANIGLVGLIWFVLAYITDVYDIRNAFSWLRTQRATLIAVVTCVLFRDPLQGHVHLGAFEVPIWVLPIVAIGAMRTAYATASNSLPLRHRALVFGAGDSGRALAQAMTADDLAARGYDLVGFVDDDPDKQNLEIYGVKVLGTSADMLEIMDRERIDVLVMSVNSSPLIRADAFPHILAAREAGVHMVSMPKMYEYVTRKVAVEHAGSNYGVLFPIEDYKQPFMFDVLRRFVDIGFGVVGCVLTAAIAPFIMAINRVGNPGPLIYRQTRAGLHGKPYRIYKLRSMVVDAEKAGAQWASTNDPRITKFGNILRKTRLDELPQFWNVLIGEMSLIGPRPERPEFVEQLEKSIPMYRARHAVKPGLTGWAQVMYRYGASEEDSLIKLQYDLYYIKHRSILLDMKIVVKTLWIMVAAKGR
jgi:exopolysaccharide biosynthesis polyprenyl glycosylphosphotransferase